MPRLYNAGIAAATVAASEQVMFKSDKGTAPLLGAVKQYDGGTPCQHYNTFILLRLAVLLVATIGVLRRTITTMRGTRTSTMATRTTT